MRPILCDSTKTLPALVADSSNGLGRLECISAEVNEAANGKYVATIEYPLTGDLYDSIQIGGLVKMKANDCDGVQLFRIRDISRPANGKITISLNHISYDLNKTSVTPFSATGIANALSALSSHIVSSASYPFTYSTDLSNSTSTFLLTKPQSVRACIGGTQGSLLDVFGGQLKWDNLTVNLLDSRGSDRNVRIAYGKNITDIKMDENIEAMYTAVQPYVIVDDNAVLGDLQTIVSVTYPKILNLDLTSYFDEGVEITTAMINAKAQQYIAANNLNQPRISIDVSFLPLWQTEDYKDIAPLERVGLFDTVHISFSPLGIEASAKVTEYKYDSLNERYNSVHLGDAKSTLSSTITQMITGEAKKNDQSTFIGAMTNVILNSLGLFSTKVLKANGGYQYYLHNQPLLADSQYQWTMTAGAFAVSQDYGATWTAGIDASGNAVFNSLSANIIRAMEIYGSYIEGTTIKFESGSYSVTASPTTWVDDDAVTYGGVQFNGGGDIGFIARSFGVKTTDTTRGIQIETASYLQVFADYGGFLIDENGIDMRCNNGTHTIQIKLDKTNGLGIWVDGTGHSGLHFVDDGNGHAVLGI